MIEFSASAIEASFKYHSELESNSLVLRELQDQGSVTIGHAFTFEPRDLIAQPMSTAENELESFEYEFRFASRSGDYFDIEGRILNIPNRVLIADTLKLSRKLFVAERNISIFRRIAELIKPDQDVVIGGDRPDAIPVPIFEEFLKKFPNSTELDRYANARVEIILGDYFQFMKDARGNYETYLNRTRSAVKLSWLDQQELLQIELQKYIFIRDTIDDLLSSSEQRSERDWQKMILDLLLLIFPKYVLVLENIQVPDSYSSAATTRKRFIDIALVDANGNVDVIELKKPFDNALLSRNKYRDNSVPSRELSGSIMQAEKYLFHLSKWGINGERELTRRYETKLPTGMHIRITNPKGMIILGRDRGWDGAALDPVQLFDLEVIKRKYANMMDIMTYDDLLRRLDNIIDSLRRRTETAR